MKGSANKAKEGNQLYFLHHILGPMQFYIAVHIDVEMINLPLLASDSYDNPRAAVACGPHLTHIQFSWVTRPCGGPERNELPLLFRLLLDVTGQIQRAPLGG